jgi:hypothetical protein
MVERIHWWRIGGLAALSGGLLWGAKSASILLTGYQPPVVFDVAPVLFALTVVALASGLGTGIARAAQAVGGIAFVAGAVALASELSGEFWAPALAGTMAGVIVGLAMVGVEIRRGPESNRTVGNLSLVLGLVFAPAVLIGGVLSTLGERLLEVPLLLLAGMWAWLGRLMVGSRGS